VAGFIIRFTALPERPNDLQPAIRRALSGAQSISEAQGYDIPIFLIGALYRNLFTV
jgi:hypothetical protein